MKGKKRARMEEQKRRHKERKGQGRRKERKGKKGQRRAMWRKDAREDKRRLCLRPKASQTLPGNRQCWLVRSSLLRRLGNFLFCFFHVITGIAYTRKIYTFVCVLLNNAECSHYYSSLLEGKVLPF